MKVFFLSLFFLPAIPSFASSVLFCQGPEITLAARMIGYNLSEVTFLRKYDVKNIINLPFKNSYDMFRSNSFNPVMPYPVYSIGSIRNCDYLLALPGGDMRDDNFTGLLKTSMACGGEIDLDCKTNSK